jgi:hypothetical protein
MQNSRSIRPKHSTTKGGRIRNGPGKTEPEGDVAGVSPDRAAQSLQVLKDRAAQSLQVLKDLSLCASQETKKKREDAAAETGAGSLRCALLSSLCLSPSSGACRTCLAEQGRRGREKRRTRRGQETGGVEY